MKIYLHANNGVSFFVFIFVVILSFPSFGTSLNITNLPESYKPGETISINIQFSNPEPQTEQLLVFIVEGSVVGEANYFSKVVEDNEGKGFSEESGNLSVNISVPSEIEGKIILKAYAVPWSLNRSVVERYTSYPTDGTFTYQWSGGGYGVTQDVYYLGTLIAPKPSGDTTYCSGIAFETCVLSFEDYNGIYGHPNIWDMTVSDMQSFRLVWYGVTDAEKLCARAIPEYGIGEEITNWEDFQEGDFVQLWRHSGSGHNCVFVEWVRDISDEIIGFEYWSSQSSTNGLGYRTEYFGETSGVNPDRFYGSRLKKPRDQADYDWALAEHESSQIPRYEKMVPAWTVF